MSSNGRSRASLVYQERTFVKPLQKLGLKCGTVPNHAISASSSWDGQHEPRYGRLSTPNRPGLHIGAWAARTNDSNQWIQVDLTSPTRIAGVITQGRNGFEPGQWVTRYKILYVGPSDFNWKTAKDSYGNGNEVLYGNSDRDTKVTNIFQSPVVAVKLRLVPVEWHGHISLRHEYLVS